ncbi:MAG: hypothetical protein IIA40_09835 [SAR324 cluster bacterium]|nr:hypothetical protein [SAR324 cluster bacterium]
MGPANWRGVILACLLTAMILTVCSDEEPAVSPVPDTPTDTFTIDGVTYTETASSSSPSGFDPWIGGVFQTEIARSGLFMLEGWNEASLDYDTSFDVRVQGSGVGTFTGTAISASYITPTFTCVNGTGGTLTIDTYGPVGGRITGTFSGITGFFDPSGTCPDSVSGSFDVTREPDN